MRRVLRSVFVHQRQACSGASGDAAAERRSSKGSRQFSGSRRGSWGLSAAESLSRGGGTPEDPEEGDDDGIYGAQGCLRVAAHGALRALARAIEAVMPLRQSRQALQLQCYTP